MKTRLGSVSRLLLLLGSLLLLAAPQATAQEVLMDREIRQFAHSTLEKYKDYITKEKKLEAFDFKSSRELERATLGDPYAVTFIGLRDLQEYSSEQDPARVVRDPKMLWFPVLVGNRATNKLEVLVRETLVPGAFGASRGVKVTAEIAGKLPSILDDLELKPESRPRILRVPSLAAEFFSFRSKGRHYLVPAMQNPARLQLKNGQVYPARDVLAWLRDFALTVDENTVM